LLFRPLAGRIFSFEGLYARPRRLLSLARDLF
jgi:hypothetical protein